MKEEKLHNFLNGIRQLCDESGINISDLYSGIDFVKEGISSAPSISVYVDDSVEKETKDKIKSLLHVKELKGDFLVQHNIQSIPFNVRIQFKKLFSHNVKKIGKLEPSFIFVFLQSAWLDENPSCFEYLQELVLQSPGFFIFSDVVLDVEKINVLRSTSNLFVKSATFDSISLNLETLFERNHYFLSARSFAASRSINNLLELFKIILAKETLGQKAKHALNQQSASGYIKGVNSGISQIELINDVKGKLQNYIYAYEKGFNQRMDDFFRLHTGRLFRESVEIINSLDNLEEKKIHKFIYLSVPTNFENDLLQSLQKKFTNQMVNDLVSLKDHLLWVQMHLENIATKNKFTFSSINIRFLTHTVIEKTLDNVIRIDKSFKGERLSKGLMEYMMAARKYQIILAMFLSTFGLSFIRNLKLYMIPATVLLIGFGIYSVKTSVAKERQASEKKELEKARENLLNELRRIFMEIRKEWSDVVSIYLRELFQSYIFQAEQLIKEHFGRISESVGHEKKKIQKQLQATEIMERKLIQIEKTRDAIFRENLKLQVEIKQLFLTQANSKPD